MNARRRTVDKTTDIDRSLRAITSRVRIIKKHTNSIKQLEKQIENLQEREESLTKRTSNLERRNIRLEELNQLKDEFIGIASHQLRTPVTAVKQYINLLLDGYTDPLTPSQKAFLEKAHESNDRQLRIIDDLLEVARIDSESFKLSKELIDVGEVITQTVADFEEKAQKSELAVEYNQPTKKVTIKADPDRLRMALENLLDNAINYSMPHKKITISVKKTAQDICIAIKDQGVGIAPKDHPKLFQKFSRVQNPLSVEVGGSGLGLYWADKVIRLHGGSIEVRSAAGRGSTFTVHLPKK